MYEVAAKVELPRAAMSASPQLTSPGAKVARPTSGACAVALMLAACAAYVDAGILSSCWWQSENSRS